MVEAQTSTRKGPTQRRIEELLGALDTGDRLVVSELSRLGRSLSQVIQIVDDLVKEIVPSSPTVAPFCESDSGILGTPYWDSGDTITNPRYRIGYAVSRTPSVKTPCQIDDAPDADPARDLAQAVA